MPKVLNVSFPKGTEQTYHAVKRSKPKEITLAMHARNLLRLATDSTCSTVTTIKLKNK